jgi:hypothetical protein
MGGIAAKVVQVVETPRMTIYAKTSAILVAACLASAAHAQLTDAMERTRPGATYYGGPIRVFVNGEVLPTNVSPIVRNDLVYVPVRGVFERFGANLTYNRRTRTVTALRGRQRIVARIGRSTATVNGEPKLMDGPPVIVKGRTMVPLRFFAYSLDSQVIWRPETRRVEILSSPGE